MARFELTSPDGEGIFSRVSRVARVFYQRGLVGDLRPIKILPQSVKLLGHRIGPGLIHTLIAASNPDRPAIVAPDGQWTQKEFDELINSIVNAWYNQGLSRGHRIIMMSPNSGLYGASYMAAFRGGITAVHAGYRLTTPELSYLVEHSGAKALWFDESCEAAVAGLPQSLRKNMLLLASGKSLVPQVHEFWELIRAASPALVVKPGLKPPQDNIVYTSGTTGKPKGAVRDMAGLQFDESARLLEDVPIQAGDRHLIATPMYHSGGQLFFLLASLMGNTIYIQDDFEPEDLLRRLTEHKINSLFLVPTMIQRILALPDKVKNKYKPNLRLLISGAAPFSHDLRMQAARYFGAPCLRDFYGSTETGWVTLIDGGAMATHPGSIGRPISGTVVRILKKDGSACATKETGEIFIENHQTISGYDKDHDATQSSIKHGGFSAGDLGYQDEDGFLYLAGRAKEMIISGGVNIYPREIEEAVESHPAVAEAAVFGIPNPEWNEIVACAYVAMPGTAIDEAELTSWLRLRLAGFKIPRYWLLLSVLPHNPTGKVLKRELQAQVANQP